MSIMDLSYCGDPTPEAIALAHSIVEAYWAGDPSVERVETTGEGEPASWRYTSPRGVVAERVTLTGRRLRLLEATR